MDGNKGRDAQRFRGYNPLSGRREGCEGGLMKEKVFIVSLGCKNQVDSAKLAGQ